jgi:hypothetical protein
VTKLHLASDLTLPADIATAVTLIAGKRGSGKTNTAKRLVEQLHGAHVPFGVLDPVDVWWGLKAGRAGDREGGLPIYVFGGKHQDYPLAPTGGGLMADLFVDYRISAVMALREWSGGERARFVKDFASRLLERNSEPFVVVAEEAHDLMPQQAMGDEKGSLGAMLRMVKLGRSGGIGLLELTQRLAALNKTATTQADVLVIHRTTGPQDRKALNDWIAEHHASDEERDAFLRALPELKTGEAFVWAPDFPEDKPLGLQRVKILACETFNSHATPKVGEKRVEPKELTAVDLTRLSKAMQATVEKAKQDDPAELRKTIATLRREVAAANAAKPAAAAAPKVETKYLLRGGELARFEKALDKLEGSGIALGKFMEITGEIATVLRADLALALSAPRPSVAAARSIAGSNGRGAVRADHVSSPAAQSGRGEASRDGAARTSANRGTLPATHPARTPERAEGGAPKRYLQKILDALASLEAIGYARATNLQVATWSKMSVRGGAYGSYLRELSAARMIERDGNNKHDQVWLTPAGREAAKTHDLATSDLHAMAHAVAKAYLHKLLDPLLEAYPSELSLDDLAERAGMSTAGGAFGSYIRELRALGFATVTKESVRAADALFLEERATA